MRLLYIDDDDIDRMALSRLARKFPEIQLTTAASLGEALSIIQQPDAIDLILSDYHLGIDHLTEFAAKFNHIPFFILSGKDKIEEEAELRRLGMIGKFSKPIQQEQLQKVVDWFGGDSEMEQEEIEKYGESYLDHLTQGDPAFRHILLTKLGEELESVLTQLSALAAHPDQQLLLLLVHQLKYKTTLLDADSTLQWCKDLEEKGKEPLSPETLLSVIGELQKEVEDMREFTRQLIGEVEK